jgi:hypothetical protein
MKNLSHRLSKIVLLFILFITSSISYCQFNHKPFNSDLLNTIEEIAFKSDSTQSTLIEYMKQFNYSFTDKFTKDGYTYYHFKHPYLTRDIEVKYTASNKLQSILVAKCDLGRSPRKQFENAGFIDISNKNEELKHFIKDSYPYQYYYMSNLKINSDGTIDMVDIGRSDTDTIVLITKEHEYFTKN